ncbi:parallel beta-helix repeat (two copies) [bacterium A37T11]|nr:parallel beta-helix repeat (two copies) [bacterium A37T11]
MKEYVFKFVCTSLMFLTVIPMIACNQQLGNENKDTADSTEIYFGKLLDVSDYGAKGDGKSDDTKAIQKVINEAAAGDTVLIPEGTFLVRTIRMRAYVNLKGVGLLKQPRDTSSPQLYSKEKQNSNMPLIRIHRITDVSLSFRAETSNEAIYVSTASNISIHNSQLTGDTSKFRSYPGVLMYGCHNCQISDNDISGFGKARQSVKTYQPGTGIRLMNCEDIHVLKNHIHHNGENGIFVHASARIDIDENDIHHNGMSGVQIAFGNSALEKYFTITNNKILFNAADAIDINNRSSRAAAPIHCLIAGNLSLNNGFVQGHSTIDGSGIATLINVSDVRVRNNKAYKNNRPALYLENCGTINFRDNQTDGTVEINQQFDTVSLVGNHFGRLLLLANAVGKRLLLQENVVKRLSFPNGIRADSLLLLYNEILSGPININMNGHLRMLGNSLNSQDPAGALILVRANTALIEKNKIQNSRFYAIVTRKGSKNFQLDSNRIASVNACVNDDGSEGLRVTNNVFISLPGGQSMRTFMSNNPKQLWLQNNEHRNRKDGKNIVLSGRGTANIQGETYFFGKPDFGTVLVKSY